MGKGLHSFRQTVLWFAQAKGRVRRGGVPGLGRPCTNAFSEIALVQLCVYCVMMDRAFGYVQNACLKESSAGGLSNKVIYGYVTSKLSYGMATQKKQVFQKIGKKYGKQKLCYVTS